MKVLMVGKDKTIFSGNNKTGDTRLRHEAYADALKKYDAKSSIDYICYTSSRDLFSEEKVDGLRIIPTNSRHRALFILDVLKRTQRSIKEGFPTIISVQTPYEEGLVALWLKTRYRIRFQVQLHFNLFSTEWASEHWMNPLRKMISAVVIKQADHVRVVSHETKRELIDQLKIDPSRISVIPVSMNYFPILCTDEERRARKEALQPGLGKYKTVLFVGRLVEQKNLPRWFEVAQSVREKYPDVRFIIVGGGKLQELVRAIVESKGLTEDVIFAGPVEYEKLPEYFAASDVFLLTSDYEGFGRVLVESQASGVPAVSSDIVGPRDIINHEIDGFLVPKDDINGYAECIIGLFKSRERRVSVVAEGLKNVEMRFGKVALVEALVNTWV